MKTSVASFFDNTVTDMIAEQGAIWAECPDFENRTEISNAVIVTDNPDRCYRLFLRDGVWNRIEDRLTWNELAQFFAAFGTHWTLLRGVRLDTTSGPAPIRAFIKNGRIRGGWSVSIKVPSA